MVVGPTTSHWAESIPSGPHDSDPRSAAGGKRRRFKASHARTRHTGRIHRHGNWSSRYLQRSTGPLFPPVVCDLNTHQVMELVSMHLLVRTSQVDRIDGAPMLKSGISREVALALAKQLEVPLNDLLM